MPTFIKSGLWEKRTLPGQGYKGELNLENLVTNLIEQTPGAQGPQGIQGPVGPQGVPGPVGPMGLTWQGAWSASGTYALNDAVGYDGASWFCIDAVGPSATTPDVDTTHWALLAAQGAPGPAGATGAQGPTGPQGPAGSGGGGNTITVKVSFTAAQLNTITLFNYLTIVAAAPGKTIIPIGATYYYKFNSTQFSSTAAIFYKEALTGTNFNLGNVAISSNTNVISKINLSTTANLAGVDVLNNSIALGSFGNVTSGNGTLDVYLTYAEL